MPTSGSPLARQAKAPPPTGWMSESGELRRCIVGPRMHRVPLRAFCAGVIALSGCNLTFVDEEGYRLSKVPDAAVIVDGTSRGGRCDDDRSPQVAREPATPWCTLLRALE